MNYPRGWKITSTQGFDKAYISDSQKFKKIIATFFVCCYTFYANISDYEWE